MAARKLHKLSARDIARLKTVPGKHSDGGCLYLWVTDKLSASIASIRNMSHAMWEMQVKPTGTSFDNESNGGSKNIVPGAGRLDGVSAIGGV
jgi:hypothetical protein